MRRSLVFLALLFAVAPAHPAERPMLPRPLDASPRPAGPLEASALEAPPACSQGNLNPISWAVADWIWGAEEYATVFTAASASCDCAGGFVIDAVHLVAQFGADDVPITFNVSVGLYPLVFDTGVGCRVPAPSGCDSSVHEVTIEAAGTYDIGVPLDADCGCSTFDADYAIVFRFPDALASYADAVTDDSPIGCTSFNYYLGWNDVVTDADFPGELSMYADASCCDGTICSTPLLPIPDFPAAGASDSIVIPGPVTDRLDVDLLLETTHTLVGDLTFTLEHVDTGTTVTPFDRPGVPADSDGCLGDDIDVRLNDEGTGGNVETTCLGATPTIAGDLVGGDPPSTALFRPFEDEDPTGTWTLTITDAVGGDTGTLDRWCLDLSSTLIFMDGFESTDWCAWSFPGCV